MPCAICGTDPPFCLLLLVLLLHHHQRVLPLWSFSHLTKRYANHSAAGASLAACGSFNRCQCASYGRRLNQLLNSDRESAQLKCAFYHSGCEPTQAKTGRNTGSRTFYIHFRINFYLAFDSFEVRILILQPSHPVRSRSCARSTDLEIDFFFFLSVGGEV